MLGTCTCCEKWEEGHCEHCGLYSPKKEKIEPIQENTHWGISTHEVVQKLNEVIDRLNELNK